jgi:hypothetical protein
MTELFDIEPTVPKWRKLAEIHGIECEPRPLSAGVVWIASIDDFEATETDSGETEKEAVVTLIHRLKLTGWETVSL